MAGAKFQYDESGGTFFYFLLSFLALVVIPSTYYFWPKDERDSDDCKDRKRCRCNSCAVKRSRLKSKEPWRKAKQRVIKFLLILGWIAMIACGYKVANLKHDYVQWDPFEILQVDPSASEVEIRKAYRRLSLVYHPDKDTGDEQKFMMIAKAYAALTDEEARKNWEMYGNPDGPGATSFGIALPSWIVEKENSLWVLGLYALVFMIALPIAVGVWWYRSAKYGEDQVLVDTTQLYLYFINKSGDMQLKRIIMILAASLEFEKGHNSEIVQRPTDDVELPPLIKQLSNFLNEKNKERPLCCEYSIKARALIHAHLQRHDLTPTLEEDKLYIVKKTPYLLQDFVNCASQLTMLGLAGRISRIPKLETLENAMKLCAMIVQAQWDNKSPLLQLPHVTEDMLKHFTTKKRNIRSIQQLVEMKDDDRRALFRGLSDDQYDDIVNCLAKMPHIDVEESLEVLDDEDEGIITAESLVTVTVKVIRKDLGTMFNRTGSLAPVLNHAEAVEPAVEEIIQSAAGDNSPHQRKPKAWEKPKKNRNKGGKSKKKASRPSGGGGKANQLNKKILGNAIAKTEGAAEVANRVEDVAQNSDSDSDQASSHSGQEDSVTESTKNKTDDEDDENDWQNIQHKVYKKEKALEKKSKKSHSVHCPLFPDDKQEYWWIYITEKKKRSLKTIPFLMTNLVEEEEAVLKFTAPSKAGIYNYSLNVRSDSYLDFNVVRNIKIDVKPAKKAIVSHPQWEMPDEEEEKDEEESAVEDSDLATDESDDEK